MGLKIKCPFCDEVVNTKHMSLYDHWCDVHDADEICIAHSNLIFKIHETIERLENPKDPYDGRLGDNDKIIILKSLLEDENRS